MQDAFQQVEQEFFRLRGQFAVGRITPEEYDEALRHLQVRDAEGRVWMLGANSGRWYYSTSPQWVESEPIRDSQAAAEQVVFSNRPSVLEENQDTPPPVSEPIPQPDELVEEEAPGSTRRLALVFFGIGIAFLLVAFAFFILFAPNNNLFAGAVAEPTRTRIVPRSATRVAQNSDADLPTATATRTPTVATSSFGAAIPVTFTPTPGLVIEPTSTEPALTVIPTVTPNANPGSNPNPNNPNEDPNAPADPRIDALPPAVYITNIRVAPNPPPKRGPATFTASFYNTNRESVGMNWRIILLNPNRQGNNKDYGESPHAGITVPPGRTDFSITYVPVSEGAGCITLQAFAARRRDDGSRDFLLAPGGGRFNTSFTFC
jgi:hypothetical protein